MPLESAQPDTAVVLRALALFLEQDLRPRLSRPPAGDGGAAGDRGAAFRARIAAHLLTVAATESEVGPTRRQADADAWRQLLGDAPVPLPVDPAAALDTLRALEARLCAALRDGAVDPAAARDVVMGRLQAELSLRSPMYDPTARCDDRWPE